LLAIFRYITLAVAFLLINFVVFVFCLVRPFHRDNVHLAGQCYSLMARIAGLRLIVRQHPSIENNVPYVFIANHQNSFDLITVCKAALPGVVTVGKKSLKWIPIFGQIYWLSGNIMIDRGHSGRARDTLQQVAEKISRRRLSVWFFPEGTRSYGRPLLAFKTGAFRVAEDTGASVVMVTCSNLHKKVKWNRWNNGVVIMELSAPVSVKQFANAKESADFFHTAMAQRFAELNDEVAVIEKKG